MPGSSSRCKKPYKLGMAVSFSFKLALALKISPGVLQRIEISGSKSCKLGLVMTPYLCLSPPAGVRNLVNWEMAIKL